MFPIWYQKKRYRKASECEKRRIRVQNSLQHDKNQSIYDRFNNT